MKMVAMIALAVALGLAWMGAAIPQDKPSTTESMKDKMKTAGEKTKDKAVEITEKTKEKVGAGKPASSEEVRTAQRALRSKGYNPGPADGAMGPRTEAAVRQFQQKEGLKETGRLDIDTRARLGMTGAGASASPATAPARKP